MTIEPPTATLSPQEALAFLRAQTPKFRGEIWENARRFRLVGAGYKSMPPEQDGYFLIRTMNHLRGPLKALRDPDVRLVFIVGATQCGKSVAGDIWIVHLVEHEGDSILCLFEDDPKAKLYASTRCMDTVKAHRPIAKMIEEVVEETGQGRHQIQSTQIKFSNSRLLKICGLNDGNVSSLSWRYLWISEAWQHKSDGLLRKAIRRADRYAGRSKILIESQAGDADEDLHREAGGARQVSLTWACPYCGGRQSWECADEYRNPRGPGWAPLRPSAAGAEWVPPAMGSASGMKIPPAELRDSNSNSVRHLSLEERARAAAWECHWCGTAIEDTPELRLRIADSYEQEYRRGGAPGAADGASTAAREARALPERTPAAVCFILPRESNYTNSFAEGALSYLKAKEAQAGGNEVPLEDWYKSERAVFYSKKLSQIRVPVITGSVLDPKVAIPNESFRSLAVDCQKDLLESMKAGKDLTGNFWVVAEAHDKAGGTFMLYRGWVTSWEELFGTVEIRKAENGTEERVIAGGLKNRLHIPTRNVAIDGGNWFDLVKEKAAHYRTREAALDGSGRQVWATWKIMVGDDAKGVRWEDGVWRSYWPPKTYVVDVLEGNRWLKIMVQVTRWSNYAVKSILMKLRMGAPGQPKFIALPEAAADAKTRAKEQGGDKGEFSYEGQMNGFALGEDARGRPKFIELHPQQHYPDCHCQGIVLKMMHGLVRGETAAGEMAAQESKN